MQEEIKNSIMKRYRVNVRTSTTGKHTWDATVEFQGENVTMEMVVAESDKLAEQMDKRYKEE
jgi:hypothetical protein